MSYRERQTRKGRRAKTPAQLRRAVGPGSWGGWPPEGAPAELRGVGEHWVTWPADPGPPEGTPAEAPPNPWAIDGTGAAYVRSRLYGDTPADPGLPGGDQWPVGIALVAAGALLACVGLVVLIITS